jgi:hypothetical protein
LYLFKLGKVPGHRLIQIDFPLLDQLEGGDGGDGFGHGHYLEYAVDLHGDSGRIPAAEGTGVKGSISAGHHSHDCGNLPPGDTGTERVIHRATAGGGEEVVYAGRSGEARGEKVSPINGSHDCIDAIAVAGNESVDE